MARFFVSLLEAADEPELIDDAGEAPSWEDDVCPSCIGSNGALSASEVADAPSLADSSKDMVTFVSRRQILCLCARHGHGRFGFLGNS